MATPSKNTTSSTRAAAQVADQKAKAATPAKTPAKTPTKTPAKTPVISGNMVMTTSTPPKSATPAPKPTAKTPAKPVVTKSVDPKYAAMETAAKSSPTAFKAISSAQTSVAKAAPKAAPIPKMDQWIAAKGDRLLGNMDWREQGKKTYGLTDKQMDAYVTSPAAKSGQVKATAGKSSAEIQAKALGSDTSASMQAARLGVAFTPVLGTATAAANAVGAAQRGDKEGVFWNSLQAVAPMGIGAVGKMGAKVATKVAPVTSAKVVAGVSKAGAKINTKITQPLNSKITALIGDAHPAADAAQKIVTDSSKTIRSTTKSANKLVGQEARAAKSGKSVVSEAQAILKNPDKLGGTGRTGGYSGPTKPPTGGTGGGGGTGSSPKFTPRPGGGGGTGKQATVARQVFDQSTGSYRTISQPVTSGGRVGSTSGSRASMSAGLPKVTKSVNGSLGTGKSGTLVLERPTTSFTSSTITDRIIKSPNGGKQFTSPLLPGVAPTKTGSKPLAPYVNPTKTTDFPSVSPVTAPKPKPSEVAPWKPRTEPVKPVTPKKDPGVSPNAPLRSPIIPKPSVPTKPVKEVKKGTEEGPRVTEKVDNTPKEGLGTVLGPKYSPTPRVGTNPSTPPGTPPRNPDVIVKAPTTNSPRVMTRIIAASERNATQGPIQSNWADYRQNYTGRTNTETAIDPLHEAEQAQAATESGKSYTPRRRSASFSEGKTTYTPIVTVTR